MTILAKHDHSDSRLRCQDCEDLICPKCMVQCAVGSRCKKCAGRFKSHVVQASPAIMVRTGLAALAAGFVFGNLEQHMLGMGYLYTWILLAVAGIGVSKLLHRISSYKIGAKIALAVIAGLLVGLILSPARDNILGYLATLSQPETKQAEANTIISLMTWQMASIIFFIGCSVSSFFNK